MDKIYVDDNNQATIICPNCGFEKIIDAKNYMNTKNMVKGRCKCKRGFQFSLEYRKHYRKAVMLPGKYINLKNREKGELIIRELSLIGIRFETLKPHNILENDTLEVEFILDNPLRTVISKFTKAIWVNDRIVGVYFDETELYKHVLKFYMTT